jgi:hypothetical protein
VSDLGEKLPEEKLLDTTSSHPKETLTQKLVQVGGLRALGLQKSSCKPSTRRATIGVTDGAKSIRSAL